MVLHRSHAVTPGVYQLPSSDTNSPQHEFVTKADLDSAMASLKELMDARFDTMDARFSAMDDKIDSRISAAANKLLLALVVIAGSIIASLLYTS